MPSPLLAESHKAMLAICPDLEKAHDLARCLICGPERAELNVPESTTDIGEKIAAAVQTETASLATEKAAAEQRAETAETRVTALETEIASLTADKAAAEQRAVVAETALQAHLDAITAAEERETRKVARVEAANAANPGLVTHIAEQADAYADMSEDAFAATLTALKAAAVATPHEFASANDEAGEPVPGCGVCAQEQAHKVHVAAPKSSDAAAPEVAAEVASQGATDAFKGGVVPAPTKQIGTGAAYLDAWSGVNK